MGQRVLLLHTGGTLGMRPRDPDQALEPDEFGTALLEHAPELEAIAEIQTRVICNLDSSCLTPAHWKRLAAEITANIDDYSGFVITHGTDSMAYTASALSYLMWNLPKPVILTGSQRPLAEPRTDARANLVGAVDLATREIPEVAIYFHGALLRGNRATKRSSFAFGAFLSPNYPPLAEVGTDIKWVADRLCPAGSFQTRGDFDPRVGVIRLLPGQETSLLDAIPETSLGAVLIEAFGVGNIPLHTTAVADALRVIRDSGKIVAIGSQSPHGRVDLDRYAGGKEAVACGAVGTGDMTLEAAAVKLMYLLGTTNSVEEAEARLLVPLAGEVSSA